MKIDVLRSQKTWLPRLHAIVLMFFLASGCGDSPHDKGEECSHQFANWAAVDRTQDWNYGPLFWQSRACSKCGYAEIRTVKP